VGRDEYGVLTNDRWGRGLIMIDDKWVGRDDDEWEHEGWRWVSCRGWEWKHEGWWELRIDEHEGWEWKHEEGWWKDMEECDWEWWNSWGRSSHLFIYMR